MHPLVCVVDDERVIAETVAAILNAAGFRALAFTDPTKALGSARSEAPILLISDVMMPEMNGIELAIRLKALCPVCKVLLFSGYETAAHQLKAVTENGEDFVILEKPIHPKDLLERIRNL
jgi:DNA-binding response OmpR family regulator